MKFCAFEHQRSVRIDQRHLGLDPLVPQFHNGPKPSSRSNRERFVADRDGWRNEWPVSADLDDVARLAGRHRFGERGERAIGLATPKNHKWRNGRDGRRPDDSRARLLIRNWFARRQLLDLDLAEFGDRRLSPGLQGDMSAGVAII